jgi:hypothetical protein
MMCVGQVFNRARGGFSGFTAGNRVKCTHDVGQCKLPGHDIGDWQPVMRMPGQPNSPEVMCRHCR